MNGFEERMLVARVKSLEEKVNHQAKQNDLLGKMVFTIRNILELEAENVDYGDRPI